MSTTPAKCKCADAGFPSEFIKFEQAGTKPDGTKYLQRNKTLLELMALA